MLIFDQKVKKLIQKSQLQRHLDFYQKSQKIAKSEKSVKKRGIGFLTLFPQGILINHFFPKNALENEKPKKVTTTADIRWCDTWKAQKDPFSTSFDDFFTFLHDFRPVLEPKTPILPRLASKDPQKCPKTRFPLTFENVKIFR